MRVSVTYDIVTPASAEEGDAAERGYIDPRTERERPTDAGRKRDIERTERAAKAGRLNWSLRDAIAFIGRQNCARHETDWTQGANGRGLAVYATDAYETQSTDARPGVLSVNYSLHVDGLSYGSFARLARVLAGNGVCFANQRRRRGDNACAGCAWCDSHGITRDDDTPACNCGTCTPPHFTCVRED